MNTVFEACNKRDDIMILAGDCGAGLMDDFKKQHPDRFLNTGIAEQNAMSFAAGLAMVGHRVVVYNIIPFLLYRCYEQVRNDVCYQKLPVVLVGVGSGVTYAPSGVTHYAVEDLGLCRTLPNLTVVSPGDATEARSAAMEALDWPGPIYVRIAKVGGPVMHSKDVAFLNVGIPRVIDKRRPNSDVAILFHGSVSSEVMLAAEELGMNGAFPKLVSVPTVQPVDFPELHSILYDHSIRTKKVIVVEEHYRDCGLGSTVQRWNDEMRHPFEVTVLGLPPEFIHVVRDTAGMREIYGISYRDIVEAVKAAVMRT